MSKRRTANYSQMSEDELEAIAARFDRSMVIEESKPLSAAMRETHRRARRGRPKVGAGAEKIRISVERGLLKEADALARKRKITRSELVARGLRAAILLAG